MLNFDYIIIGGGIVGVATAYQLQLKAPNAKILLIEKEASLAAHQTGHNSGVIHSGIYYKPGSEKAVNCIRGYKMLLDYCSENYVKHELCGKIIVATDETEIPRLHALFERGKANGLTGLKLLSKEETAEIEPNVSGITSIWVPQTGIIDYKEVTESIANSFVKKGGVIQLGEKVLQLKEDNFGNSIIETSKSVYSSKITINCAGLYSDKLAKWSQSDLKIKILPFRGEYYTLKPSKQQLVKNLIYPVPDPAFPFLGVHFTRMINGGIEAGPNAVLAFAREGYTKSNINLKELLETLFFPGFIRLSLKYGKVGFSEMYRSFSKMAFTKSLQKLIPAIEMDDLQAGGAGVRAQACDREGNLLDDFYFIERKNTIHVCNAPSPAATSSLSIGLTLAEKAIAKSNG